MDAELAEGREEIHAAMRRSAAAVFELGREFVERALKAKEQSSALAAALYQLAGESYLVVHVNIRGAGEMAMLTATLAVDCYREAARLYEACGEVEHAAGAYRELAGCLHLQKLCMINRRNVAVVTEHLYQEIQYCEEKLRQLAPVMGEPHHR
ncbi:hypothetical protein [Candidatus Pyrohabitans sp.]